MQAAAAAIGSSHPPNANGAILRSGNIEEYQLVSFEQTGTNFTYGWLATTGHAKISSVMCSGAPQTNA
jgi:hypothetical protein